ncbi:hypothetical protein Tco_1473684 [Tanacetum coccineum]
MDDADSAEVKMVKLEKRAWDAELDMGDSSNYMTEEMLEKLGFAWDAELDMGDSCNYMTKEMLEKLGFIRIEYSDYGRRMKLDEVLMGIERLSNKEFSEEDKVRIIELGLPKKISDLGNYVLPVQVNGVVEISALADTSASVSVLPYSLYQNIGLGDPKPYHSNLTVVNNTQAKAIGEVRNVRIQIGYQAYLVDFLVLDIPVDNELPLLLGRPFLGTYGAVIDIGRGTMCIDDGVIRHTFFPKSRVKTTLDNFENEEENWLVQLKDTNWGNEVHRLYKKVNGDGAWHEKFKIITPSGRKFTKGFKIKETKRKLSGKFTLEDILKFDHFQD